MCHSVALPVYCLLPAAGSDCLASDFAAYQSALPGTITTQLLQLHGLTHSAFSWACDFIGCHNHRHCLILGIPHHECKSGLLVFKNKTWPDSTNWNTNSEGGNFRHCATLGLSLGWKSMVACVLCCLPSLEQRHPHVFLG